jgi:hypothetical protein
MGVVIIILAAKLRQVSIFKSDNEDVQRIGDAAFFLMIIFGCIAAAISILGFLTAWCNKCFCIGCVSDDLEIIRTYLFIFIC